MDYKIQAAICLLSAVLVAVPAAAESPLDLYESASDYYSGGKYAEALSEFEELVEKYPEHKKADNALLYIGRIRLKQDEESLAAEAFRKVLDTAGSNCTGAASVELAGILYAEDNFEEASQILKFVEQLTEYDSAYELSALELQGKTYYNLGRKALSEYRNEEAAHFFRKSEQMFDILLSQAESDDLERETLYRLGKVYRQLAEMDYSSAYYSDYFDKAVKALVLADTPRSLRMAVELKDERFGEGYIRSEAGIGIASYNGAPGFKFEADAGFDLPAAYRFSISGNLCFLHDPFVFKTFNFNPAKNGDARLMQGVNSISAELKADSGSRRDFMNTAGLKALIRFAEDPGDSSAGIDLFDNAVWRINSEWETGWKACAGWKTYPDYLSAGRSLDSIDAGAEPYVSWFPADGVEFGLKYTLGFKHYLNAFYDTPDRNVRSESSKQYLTNSAEISLSYDICNTAELGLDYRIEYRKSFNHNVWITDSAGAERYMEGCSDYMGHRIKADLDLEWNESLTTDVSFSAEYRNYPNYIVRDADGIFSAAESLRTDLDLSVELDTELLLWADDGAGEGLFFLNAEWNKPGSNMEYERSFDTNSSGVSATTGIRFRLR